MAKKTQKSKKNKESKQTQIQKHTLPRYVAFFDILGFKNMLQQGTHHAVKQLEVLVNYLEGDKGSPFVDDENVKHVVQFKIFSDSIFMYTTDDSFTSWRLFTYAVSSFFYHALKNKIPIKGGIAHGDAFIGEPRSNLKNVMCGKAITNAFLIQEELQYFGVAVHYTFESHLEKKIKVEINDEIEDEYLKDSTNLKKVLSLYSEIHTPLKVGTYMHLNLNLFKFSASWVNFSDEYLEILKEFKLNSPSASRKYIDNSIKAWNELENIVDN